MGVVRRVGVARYINPPYLTILDPGLESPLVGTFPVLTHSVSTVKVNGKQ